MGEFSAVNGIKSIVKDIPSFCVRGIKLSEHLGDQLKGLNIDIKEDAKYLNMILELKFGSGSS